MEEYRPFKDWTTAELIRLKKMLVLKRKICEMLKQKGFKLRLLTAETKTANELPI